MHTLMHILVYQYNIQYVALYFLYVCVRGVATLTLMVGHKFYNTMYLLLYLMACLFIRAFIYRCFKMHKVRVAIAKL